VPCRGEPRQQNPGTSIQLVCVFIATGHRTMPSRYDRIQSKRNCTLGYRCQSA
jgi:hypothetical protein